MNQALELAAFAAKNATQRYQSGGGSSADALRAYLYCWGDIPNHLLRDETVAAAFRLLNEENQT